MSPIVDHNAVIQLDDAVLYGDLTLPPKAGALVVFAHGSGSSRFSPRNRQVAQRLQRAGLGTLLLDLLTPEEGRADQSTGAYRFDIALLGRRVTGAIDWLQATEALRHLRLGLFGASTGAAAALLAAAARPDDVDAVVSRGGRPDLAGAALDRVRVPTLLIVGALDIEVIELNRAAARHLHGPHTLHIVPGATHLFEEPGTLEQVADLAADWFVRHLITTRPTEH